MFFDSFLDELEKISKARRRPKKPPKPAYKRVWKPALGSVAGAAAAHEVDRLLDYLHRKAAKKREEK